MSNTNRVTISATVESTLGVVPSTPVFTELWILGAPGLAFAPSTETSGRIRADRMQDDLILVGGEAAGDINSELAFFLHDEFLEGAMFSTFQDSGGDPRTFRVNDETGDMITAVTGTEFTVTDEGDAPIVDDIIRAENFEVAANNAVHIIDGTPSNTSFSTATANAETLLASSQARVTVVGRRGAADDLETTISGSTGTLVSSALDLTTLGITIGDWICLDGFSATPANNGFYRVSLAPAAALLTFDRVPTGAVTEAPAGAVDIYLGDRLINGTTLKTYTLEEQFGDHSPDVTYQYFRGMGIDSLVITAPSQAVVTVATTFMGKDSFFSTETNPATTGAGNQLPGGETEGRATGAVSTTTPPTSVLNSSSNVARIAIDGSPITSINYVTEMTIELKNNLRHLAAVGILGSVDLGFGETEVTGSMSTFFDSDVYARSVIANEALSADMRFVDADDHVLLFDIPKLKFEEGSPEVASKNEDTTLALTYRALRHPTFGYVLLIQRFYGFVKTA